MKYQALVSIIVILLVSNNLGQARAAVTAPDTLTPGLRQMLSQIAPGSYLTVIVLLKSQPNLAALGKQLKAVAPGRRSGQLELALRSSAEPAQVAIRARLSELKKQGQVERVVPFWIINGLSVTAQAAVIQELASRPDVLRIDQEEAYPFNPDVPAGPLSELASVSGPNPNISLLNAPALWALGFKGRGVVVATMDSGVDGTHPDLASRYRGGTNSWFDPYGQHATPVDLTAGGTGHGTATMSLIAGGDASGYDIGMAPEAQWISVKLFNDGGQATTTAIHQGFQWLLDPDGNPETADAPQVVSNSWGGDYPGCDLSFQADVQALRAAGILPVFSAGNYGSSSGTGISPGNYPEAFPVGAIDNSSNIASFSSRGPDACGRSQMATYPLMVAPGVSVPVAAPGGGYTYKSGTSFSGPETAGALALLLSAFPNLTPDEQAEALIKTAVDLGDTGPDNNYGYGRVDVYAAFRYRISLIDPSSLTIKRYIPLFIQ